jgi:trimethylamine--corrinoid protein Co-methyltransferase
VLENTGLRIEHKGALKLLKQNGCRVDHDEQRVRIPPGLAEECLRRCPGSFHLRARDPQKDLVLGGNTVYFGPAPGMKTVDLTTWDTRMPTRQEFYDAVTVLDALENVHYMHVYTPWFGFEGLPPIMCIPETFAAQARNSDRVLRGASTSDYEIFTMQMAEAVGVDAPVSCLVSSPLTYYGEAIEALYRAVEANFPLSIGGGGTMGSSAPATIAGATLVNNAELIAPIVLAQLLKPGTRVLVQDFEFPQNMQSGAPVFGTMESSMHSILFNQYFRRLGIPRSCGNAGFSNSKTIDVQCGYEKAFAVLINALAGASIIPFIGGLYGELVHHPVQAIIDNDIVGMVGRLLQGVDVSNEAMALDLIHEVGPIPGFYLNRAHTREYWKKEQFLPRAADRLTYPEWMNGSKKGAIEYASARVEEILATHKAEPLSAKQEAELERILEEARQHYRKKGLM